MKKNNIIIEIFGANTTCASCVQAPSSKDTYEWLRAAIARKYPGERYEMVYIDIDKEIDDKRQREIAAQVRNDEYFYPLVMLNGDMIGEGHIRLKPLFSALDQLGFGNNGARM